MSSLSSRIRWNSLFSFLSAAIRLGTNFLLFVGIARLYGAEAFGQFTTAHTFAVIFTLLADFGFDTLLSTEIARKRDEVVTIIHQYLSIKFIFCSIATVAMMFLPTIMHFSPETKTLVYIFSLYVFFSSLNNFFFALFRGLEQLHLETRISFLINTCIVALFIVFWFLHVSIVVIALTFVGSRIIGLVLAIRFTSQSFQGHRFQFDFSCWKKNIPQITVFGIHYLFGSLFFQLDTLLLALWKSDHDVGIYQSVFKFVSLSLVCSDIAVNAFMPTLSRFHSMQRERWNMLGELLNKILFLLALPIVLTMFVYADQIISLIYGNHNFSDAVPLLRIFSLIVLIRYSVETYALILTTSRRQTTRMAIVVTATVTNFLLNMYFISNFGLYGAALVSLTTNMLVGLGYILATGNLFNKWMLNYKTMLPLCFTIVVGVALWMLPSVNFIISVPLVVVGVCVFSYYVGFTREERKMIFAFKSGVSNV